MKRHPVSAVGALALAGVLMVTAGCASGDAEQAAETEPDESNEAISDEAADADEAT